MDPPNVWLAWKLQFTKDDYIPLQWRSHEKDIRGSSYQKMLAIMT